MATFNNTIVAPRVKELTLVENLDGDLQSGYGAAWVEGQPPVLASYSGTFTQGQTFTVIGSNFSANRQTQLFYDDFSAGTLGQPISGGATWQTAGGQAPYVYDADGLSNGKRSAYLDMQGAYDYMTGIVISPTKTLYVEHWIKYQMNVVGPDDGSGSPQMKLTRAGAGSTLEDHSDNPNITVTMLDVNASGYVGTEVQTFNSPAKSTNDASQNISGYMDLPPDGQWHKLHMAAKISDYQVANGWRYFKTDLSDHATGSWANGTQKHFASPNAVVTRESWAGENWQTYNSIDGSTQVGDEFFRKILLPYFTRSYQESVVRVAGFWANDTAERVVVSTSTDWRVALSSGIISPNISRTNTQWQFSVETGNLPASGALYLYLVNADGVFNTTPLQIRS